MPQSFPHLYELQDAVCRVMAFILMNAGLVEDYSCWICMNVVLKKEKMQKMRTGNHLNVYTLVNIIIITILSYYNYYYKKKHYLLL